MGDSFDKLSSYDFEHSRYVAFEEEYETLYFAIEDNTIKAIVYSQKQDIPYPNYDGSNSLL